MRRITRFGACAVVCCCLHAPRVAPAGGNTSVWAEIPDVRRVDYGDALARSQGFLIGLGLQPSFDLRRDADSDSAEVSGFLSGAYHFVHEGPTAAYSGRVDALWLSADARADNSTGDRTRDVDLQAAASAVELEYRHYLGAFGGFGLPLFAAGWGGVYGPSVTHRSREVSPEDTDTDPTFDDATTFLIPASISVGAGVGRLLPASLPLTVARLERMLIAHGLLDGPIEQSVADRIIRMWVAHKDELGHEQRTLLTGKLLAEAGLLRGALTPEQAYRIERIVASIRSQALAPRWAGTDGRVALRVGRSFGNMTVNGWPVELDAQPVTLAVEMRWRQVLNLDIDSDLWLEPALGFAPREKDRAANVLPGNRRVSLLGAGAPIGIANSGMMVLDVPVNYTRTQYDAFYNVSGVATFHAGVNLGLSPDEPAGYGATLGAAYTLFTAASHGFRVGLSLGFGRVRGDFVQAAHLVASFLSGTGESAYVAPGTVGDAAPVNMGWVPQL